MFRHRATIQWSSLINAEARTALSPNHNSTSTQMYTPHAYTPSGPQYSMWLIVNTAMHRIIYTTSIRHGRYCRQMERMINTERRSWQRKRRKGKVCVSVCLNCTHMCTAAHARALARLSDVNPRLFHFEYVNLSLPVTPSVRQSAFSSTLTAFQSVYWQTGTLTLATQSVPSTSQCVKRLHSFSASKSASQPASQPASPLSSCLWWREWSRLEEDSIITSTEKGKKALFF